MKAVLLVPTPGDPLGLLAPGTCGAMPPIVAWYSGLGRWEPMRVYAERQALVLAWDGKRAPEGIFRAWFQADDDAGTDLLSELLYDEGDGLPGLASAIGNLRRNGEPLGAVVTL